MADRRNVSQLWMVPFADLMSILMMLFLALFGFAYVQKNPEYEKALARMQRELGATEEEKKLSEQKEKEAEVAQRLKEEAKDAELEITTQRIKLTFASPILFAEGSARLKPEAGRTLRKVAQALEELPNAVVVEGHTDSQRIIGGRLKTNWELSAARAFSVIEFFASQGLPATRFSALGYGEHRPVGLNATEEGRALNRRIEISILRT